MDAALLEPSALQAAALGAASTSVDASAAQEDPSAGTLVLAMEVPWHSAAAANFQGEVIYAPPPLPHFWPKGIFQGRGVGAYIT